MILPAEDLTHVLKNVSSWEKLRNKRIFLTGASGFVGNWLRQTFDCANRSLELDAELNSVSRDSFPAGHFHFGIHAARADDYWTDMVGTKRILDFSVERGVSRFLFTSSGAVYGKMPEGVAKVPEDFPTAPYSFDPESGYAQAKHLGEFLCVEYAKRFHFSALIARLFSFCGPLLPIDKKFAIGNFIRDVISGGPVVIQGDGSAVRSYLYGADLAIWLWKILLDGQSARPYNVGSPDAISISELANAVVAHTKPGTKIVIVGGEAASVYVPSVDRVSSELHLQSLISLDEGIRRMYEWCLRNESTNAYYSKS